MNLPQVERQFHLDLSDSCLEIGATSRENRALLAIHLNTTCHSLGMKTGYLCHACHNKDCSNVKHLYWGSASENNFDRFINDPDLGRKIVSKRKEKYGDDFYKKVGAKGKLGWKSNKPAKALSQTEIDCRLKLLSESNIDIYSWGWVSEVSILWGISHTQVRKFFNTYWTGPKPFTRKSRCDVMDSIRVF